ncbi:MAG: tetratricopeptide repeat protein [Hyphomicrobiaceae bacterium]|nr:tetratricopeptide repeat protein [Hyphomicrobiaceae bacterium]
MPLWAASKSTKKMLRQIATGTFCAGLAFGLGGCAGTSDDLAANLLSDPQSSAPAKVAEAPQTELEKAVTYWGDKFVKSPGSLEYALNYARNLKAMGNKRLALTVLQQAASYHGQDRELASEYGRLALELDQVQVAKQVLAFADNPAKPDWRVISARGTVLAKEGNYKEAIPMFERALALSNQNPSVMNNLAMAYALDGRAAQSEQLLRQASAKGNSAKVEKNLALVLGLQGKYDEAKVVATRVLPQDAVQADTALVRQMVQLDPQPYQSSPTIAPSMIAQNRTTAGGSGPAIANAQLRPSTQPEPAAGGWTPQVATAAAN